MATHPDAIGYCGFPGLSWTNHFVQSQAKSTKSRVKVYVNERLWGDNNIIQGMVDIEYTQAALAPDRK